MKIIYILKSNKSYQLKFQPGIIKRYEFNMPAQTPSRQVVAPPPAMSLLRRSVSQSKGQHQCTAYTHYRRNPTVSACYTRAP